MYVDTHYLKYQYVIPEVVKICYARLSLNFSSGVQKYYYKMCVPNFSTYIFSVSGGFQEAVLSN